MRIGLTENSQDNRSLENYVRWIHRVTPAAEILKLSQRVNNVSSVETCDGIVFTGGGDVHPKSYGKPDALESTERVDDKRDEFEFTAVERVLRVQIPVLGICRGLQLVNVALGGSLLPDIEKSGDHFQSHLGRKASESRHSVRVEALTLLSQIVGVERGEVSTQHHQAADQVAKGLRVAARSVDGIIEALEWQDSNRRPFLLLVQWHPERMADFGNPFSKNILQRFLSAVESTTGSRNNE